MAALTLTAAVTAPEAIPAMYNTAATAATTAVGNAATAVTTVGATATYLASPAGQEAIQDAYTSAQMTAAFYANSLTTNPFQTVMASSEYLSTTVNNAALSATEFMPYSTEILQNAPAINLFGQGAVNGYTPGPPDYGTLSTFYPATFGSKNVPIPWGLIGASYFIGQGISDRIDEVKKKK
jgi:hypothetical protein